MTDQEIRLGGPLFHSESEVLVPFLHRRKEVLEERLRGISFASSPDQSELLLLKSDLNFYENYLSTRES